MMYPDINHDFRHHRVTGPERGFCGLAHVVFRFTTSPVRMPRLTRLNIAELAADIRAEGWTIRSAGPRWFTVWSQIPSGCAASGWCWFPPTGSG